MGLDEPSVLHACAIVETLVMMLVDEYKWLLQKVLLRLTCDLFALLVQQLTVFQLT